MQLVLRRGGRSNHGRTYRKDGWRRLASAVRLKGRRPWSGSQNQVSTDKRSGITNDPNRPEDREYILNLIGQVITVSLETVKIVQSLPLLGLPE